MAERHADDGTQEESTGKALKRRGILAAGGAVVAGIATQRTSQPVAAGNADHGALIIAEPNSESTAGTSLTWGGGTIAAGGAALLVTDGSASTINPAGVMIAGVAGAK